MVENTFSNDVYEKLACSYPIKEINDANSLKKKKIKWENTDFFRWNGKLESLDEVWKETYKNHAARNFISIL